MSLLSHLISNTYLPPNATQMLSTNSTQPPAIAPSTDSNQMLQHATPTIPPHPTITYTPKTPHILLTAPRKKRITYKSQDEKKEALRERSRDNRRRAKEKKEYMDRRIAWLEYENGCIRETLKRKVLCIEEMKRQLARGVTMESGAVLRVNWQELPFFVQGGAEALFSALNLEKLLFGEPEPQGGTSDTTSVASSTTQKKSSSGKRNTSSKKGAAKSSRPRSAKSVISSTSSTSSLSSFEEEEFDLEHEEDEHNAVEFRAGAVEGSSHAHPSDQSPPLRLTRAQKRKRAEASWVSGDEKSTARNPKMRVTEGMMHAAQELTHQQNQLHAPPDEMYKRHQQEQLDAFRQQQQYLHMNQQQQLQQSAASYAPSMNLYDTLKQTNASAALEQNTNRLYIL